MISALAHGSSWLSRVLAESRMIWELYIASTLSRQQWKSRNDDDKCASLIHLPLPLSHLLSSQ